MKTAKTTAKTASLSPRAALLLLAACALAACRHGAPPVAVAGQAPLPPAPDVIRPRALPTLPPLDTVVLPNSDTPIISVRLVFRAGSVDDPPGKEGLTALTAAMLTQGGTQELSSKELLRALFPMAAELGIAPSKELTVIFGRVHHEQLERFLKIFTDTLLQPRFDPRELERLRSVALNEIRSNLRGEDDEELGKIGLEALLYPGHPYGHFTGGTVQGLTHITLDDVKAQWRRVFTQDRLSLGVAGPVDDAWVARVKTTLQKLPATGAARAPIPPVQVAERQTLILEKPTASIAQSIGLVYDVRRDDPDYAALTFARSFLGEHRAFSGRLFNELREKRGLNYGDYAYAEAFEQDGDSTLGQVNLVRSLQAFTLWLRPTEPKHALFTTRGALYYFAKMLDEPIPSAAFESARTFLRGNTLLWTQTDQRRLGYAIDDRLYGTPHSLEKLRADLETLTPAQVNAALRRHLDVTKLNFVYVAQDGKALAKLLAEGKSAPITYDTPKPAGVTAQDVQIDAVKLPLDPKAIRVESAQQFME